MTLGLARMSRLRYVALWAGEHGKQWSHGKRCWMAQREAETQIKVDDLHVLSHQ